MFGPPETPEQHASSQLAAWVAELARAENEHNPAAIRKATRALRALLPDLPAGHESLPDAAVRLGLAALLHFRMTADVGFLRDALNVQRALVEASALGADTQAALLMVMCHNLQDLYGYTRIPAVLDDAVAAGRAAMGLALPGGQVRLVCLEAVASALSRRYRTTGDTASLDQAIRSCREVVEATAFNDLSDAGTRAARARSLNGLADRLGDRYLARGARADLDGAVLAAREAVAVAAADDPWRAGYLHSLAELIKSAARRGDELVALDEAVTTHQAAVDAGGPDDPERARYLIGLSDTLHERFLARADVPAHLDRAHRVAEAAVAAAREGSPQARHSALWNLRRVLATRRRRDRRAADAADARLRGMLSAAEPAVDAEVAATTRRRDDATRALREHQMNEADLGELIDLSRHLARSAPPDSRERAAYLGTLGYALRDRWDMYGAPADRREAVSAHAEVAGNSAADPTFRAGAAAQCARVAADEEDWPAAAAMYRLLIGLLPGIAGRDLRHEDQEEQIRSATSVGSDAAACAARADADAATAMGLLEQGRGILLTRAMEARTGVTVLDDRSIDHAEPIDLAADGPIVVVNASRYGSHAFIAADADVQVLPLPGLSQRDVLDRADALAVSVQLASGRHDPDHAWAASRFIESVLGWLWDSVAEPVLAALGIAAGTGPAVPRTRIWWMPVGPLSILPLHAAGHHRDGSGRSVIDLVIPSYTPTLRTLRHARTIWRGRAAVASATAVAIRQTPQQPELAHAEPEAELVRRLFPGARILTGRHATADAVIAALEDSDWVHLACHAESRPEAVWSSRLLLADRALSVAEIAGIRNPGGYLAYLSACDTARTGAGAADETVHISSAFQLAGCAHVIATLWPVQDDIAYRLATDIYKALGDDPSRVSPAHAVHEAVRRLRDRYPASPLLWASHVHAGP